MKRVDYLIAEIRKETENEDYGDNEGIGQQEFLQYLNEACQMLQGTILRNCPSSSLFDTEFSFSTVANQRAYPLPGATGFAGTPLFTLPPFSWQGVKAVEVATSETDSTSYFLDVVVPRELSRVTSSFPRNYSVQGKNILLSPIPSVSGKTVRVTLPTQVLELDLPRASVSSVSSSGGYYTKVSFTTLSVTSEEYLALSRATHICITNEYGEMVFPNLRGGLDAQPDGWVFDSSAYLTSSATISVGDVITVGGWSSPYPDSRFPEMCERYLRRYCGWKILKRDSSTDAVDVGQELSAIEADIVQSLGAVTRDVVSVPQLEPEWLDY